jgi:outer membrane receptor protein involved in Fe transport
MGREFRLIAGSDYMREDIYRERWRLLSDTGREKGEKFWDYDIDMKTISFYTQGSYQMTDSFKMIVGARYDHFVGDLTDHLEDDTTFSMKDQSVFSPKAAAIWTFLDGDYELFANLGKGFALLPGFSEQAAFKQNDWDPQERMQYEAGIRFRPVDRLKGELIVYRLTTSKDFVYDSTTDEYDNVGETVRDGIEVQAELSIFDYGYLKADYAYADARYDKYMTGSVDYHGKTLRGVPENIYNAEVGYAPSYGLGGYLSFHAEDGYYLDDANEYKSESWNRVDAQASYRFGSRAQYLACLDVVNLLDEKYADYTGGTTTKTYSPALPLSLYVTFKLEF